MLVCFWLGTTLHEQETAQSGQFAQTSNLLFPGPGKSKMVQTSNLLCSDFQFVFFQAGKKQNGSDFHFAFSRAGKKQNGSDFPFAFSRLPICFFPAREKAKCIILAVWNPAWKQAAPSACGIRARNLLFMNLAPYPLGPSSLKNMLFSRLYERKLDVQFAFPAQTSNLLFPGSYDRVVCALTAVEPTTSPHIPALVGML